MISMLYRYNSKFMQSITDYVHPIFGIEGNGFLPLKGEMDKMKVRDRIKKEEKTIPAVDSYKIGFINRMLDEAATTQIVFVVSPTWYDGEGSLYQPIKNICEKRGVKFVDFSTNEKYTHQNEYFKDGLHLNAKGADEFTKDLVSFLKKEEDRWLID